jgi:hypothetical protein
MRPSSPENGRRSPWQWEVLSADIDALIKRSESLRNHSAALLIGARRLTDRVNTVFRAAVRSTPPTCLAHAQTLSTAKFEYRRSLAIGSTRWRKKNKLAVRDVGFCANDAAFVIQEPQRPTLAR